MALYPFVAAKYFTRGGRSAAPRAIVVHMAQGGGTVSWLTHPTSDNSSDFVIEYSGRIVQMVAWADCSHSLHWDTNDAIAGNCSGTFSSVLAKKLLGPSWADPNPLIFAIEIEGFAASGPNVAQMASLNKLIAQLRGKYDSLRGVLGHRDFQDYKACPGCRVFDKIPHGAWPAVIVPPATGDAVIGFKTPDVPSTALVHTGAWLYVDSSLVPNASNLQVNPGRKLALVGWFSPTVLIVAHDATDRAFFVKVADADAPAPVPVSIAPTYPDLSVQYAAAQAALVAAKASAAASAAELSALQKRVAVLRDALAALGL